MKFPRSFRRLVLVGSAVCAAVLTAACGGGDQSEKFQPSRIVAFGDESNVVESSTAGTTDGRKYTVNFYNTTTSTIDCNQNLVWVQALAIGYGLSFPQCRYPGLTNTSSVMMANVAEGLATDLPAQVDRFLASADAPFRESDLVTFYVGTNDIVALVQDGTLTDAQKEVAARARAAIVAAQVNRVIATGAKVMFMTLPSVGNTPWGRGTAARSALARRLTQDFNNELRGAVVQDGRKVGLVDAYNRLEDLIQYPGLDGFNNFVTPSCAGVDVTVPTPPTNSCSTNTLATGATNTWYWADSIRMSGTAQRRLGDIAGERARVHPF